MTFELDTDATARRSAADTVAREVVTPAAPAADAAAAVPAAVRGAIRAIVPPSPAAASLDWVVALEALAVVSPTVAIVAAGEALGAPSVTTTAQWTGLRGADVDGLRGALAADASWHLAVTATLVGAGRAAVEEMVGILDGWRPDLVVTYDPRGGYGHPDHVRAHEVVHAALGAQHIGKADVAVGGGLHRGGLPVRRPVRLVHAQQRQGFGLSGRIRRGIHRSQGRESGGGMGQHARGALGLPLRANGKPRQLGEVR